MGKRKEVLLERTQSLREKKSDNSNSSSQEEVMEPAENPIQKLEERVEIIKDYFDTYKSHYDEEKNTKLLEVVNGCLREYEDEVPEGGEALVEQLQTYKKRSKRRKKFSRKIDTAIERIHSKIQGYIANEDDYDESLADFINADLEKLNEYAENIHDSALKNEMVTLKALLQ